MKIFELSSFIGGLVVGIVLSISIAAIAIGYIEYRERHLKTNFQLKIDREGVNLHRDR